MSEHIPEPLTYDRSSQALTAKDGQMQVADIRGWGHLTGASCRLSGEEAAAVQDATGERMAACYNAMAGIDDPASFLAATIASLEQQLAELRAERHASADALFQVAIALQEADGGHSGTYENGPPRIRVLTAQRDAAVAEVGKMRKQLRDAEAIIHNINYAMLWRIIGEAGACQWAIDVSRTMIDKYCAKYPITKRATDAAE